MLVIFKYISVVALVKTEDTKHTLAAWVHLG